MFIMNAYANNSFHKLAFCKFLELSFNLTFTKVIIIYNDSYQAQLKDEILKIIVRSMQINAIQCQYQCQKLMLLYFFIAIAMLVILSLTATNIISLAFCTAEKM